MAKVKIKAAPKNQGYMTHKARLYYPIKQGYMKAGFNKINDLNTL